MKIATKRKIRNLELRDVERIVEWVSDGAFGDCPLMRSSSEGSREVLSCDECRDVFEDLEIETAWFRHPCNKYGHSAVIEKIYELIPIWLKG